jgi:hypothetical protein
MKGPPQIASGAGSLQHALEADREGIDEEELTTPDPTRIWRGFSAADRIDEEAKRDAIRPPGLGRKAIELRGG